MRESRALFEAFNQPLWRDLEGERLQRVFENGALSALLDALHRSEDPEEVNRDFMGSLAAEVF